MNPWVGYAFLAMIFAGFTSVIAKRGLDGISGDLGLLVRTCFVFVLVLVYAAIFIPKERIGALKSQNILWLGVSGLTTSMSWIFYYKALKSGEVSTVALIDKGSFVIAVILAWAILGESITPRILAGSALILAGLLIVARK